MKNFIRIDNEFFRLRGNGDIQQTDFSLIDTEGFTLYSYLMMCQSSKIFTQTTIRMIQGFFGKNFNGLKEPLTVEKYLKALHINKFIEIINLDELKLDKELKSKNSKKLLRTDGIGLDDVLNIKVLDRSEKGFTAMPEELFINEIRKIGHIGWSILCILTNLHNPDFGGGTLGFCGFANPSQEYMGKIIKRHYKTVAEYSYILEKLKLIKIEPQPTVFMGYDKDGEEVYEFSSNHYVVRFKYDQENKYYIGHEETKKKDK